MSSLSSLLSLIPALPMGFAVASPDGESKNFSLSRGGFHSESASAREPRMALSASWAYAWRHGEAEAARGSQRCLAPSASTWLTRVDASRRMARIDPQPSATPSVQGTFAENLRAFRQLWRSVSAGLLAFKYPEGAAPPTPQQLGVLGPYPGFLFGVALPVLAGVAAFRRAEGALRSEVKSDREKIGASLAAFDGAVFAALGIVNYVSHRTNIAVSGLQTGFIVDRVLQPIARPAWLFLDRVTGHGVPWARIALRSGGVIPAVGAAYSVLSGLTHYVSGQDHGYISHTDNLIASGGEVAAGAFSLMGAWLAFARSRASAHLSPAWVRGLLARSPWLRNPYTAAGIVMVGAVMTLGAPSLHDYYSSQGVGKKLAEELAGDLPSAEKIHEHLRLTHRQHYHLFHVPSVVALLGELHARGKLAGIDWRRDPPVQELREACLQLLRQAAKNPTSPYKSRIASMLFFFALQSPDLAVQQEAISIFVQRAKKIGKSEGEMWRDFIEQYGEDLQRYRDVGKFFEAQAARPVQAEFLQAFFVSLGPAG